MVEKESGRPGVRTRVCSEKDLKNDPEFKVLLDDMSKKQEELDTMVKNHCKRWPDSPLCNKTN